MVEVKLFSSSSEKPERKTSSTYYLKVSGDVVVKSKYILIPLDLKISIPSGFKARIYGIPNVLDDYSLILNPIILESGNYELQLKCKRVQKYSIDSNLNTFIFRDRGDLTLPIVGTKIALLEVYPEYDFIIKE